MANLSALKAGGVPSTFCGDLLLAGNDGDNAVTGVGFKPNWIVIFNIRAPYTDVLVSSAGYKIGNATRAHGHSVYGIGSNTNYYSYESGAKLYMAKNAAGAVAEGVLKSFDADGFTIDRTAYAIAVQVFWMVGR